MPTTATNTTGAPYTLPPEIVKMEGHGIEIGESRTTHLMRRLGYPMHMGLVPRDGKGRARRGTYPENSRVPVV
jgi:hypothetical protein